MNGKTLFSAPTVENLDILGINIMIRNISYAMDEFTKQPMQAVPICVSVGRVLVQVSESLTDLMTFLNQLHSMLLP